jgi:transcriptional regulator with XRE-family HTH domain
LVFGILPKTRQEIKITFLAIFTVIKIYIRCTMSMVFYQFFKKVVYTMDMKKEIPITEFGSKLREIRREKGFTQAQLAEISDISTRMITHYEGYAKMPPLDKVKRLAEALGVTSDELIGTTKNEKIQNKEGLSYRLMKKFKIVEGLPKRDQDTIFSLINTFAEKNKLKKG